MDRNPEWLVDVNESQLPVALRKESVDRNVNLRVLDGSKSSVALRKESVDRNDVLAVSALPELVALRKESVDRNVSQTVNCSLRLCRSPQGERG